jgi:hypothetical protein
LNTLGAWSECGIGNKKCHNDFLLNRMGYSSLYHTFVSHSELFNIMSISILLINKDKNSKNGGAAALKLPSLMHLISYSYIN